MEELIGYIEHITYQNEDNGFTVARVKEPKISDLSCIVGTLPGLQPGETIRAHGTWMVDPAHGRQFKIDSYEIKTPTEIHGIEKYLSSGLIKGIGATYAKRIVKRFQFETLDIIENSPERLLTIPGIGKKRIELIKNSWHEQKSIRHVMIFLQQYGVSTTYAQKIFKTYGTSCIEKLKENPYRLSQDIFGIGFKIADKIAEKMGVAKNSSQRIEAGIEYVLLNLSSDGHVCFPLDEFIRAAQNILEVDEDKVQSSIENLEFSDRIIVAQIYDEGHKVSMIWLKSLYIKERGIAKELLRLRSSPCSLRDIDTDKALSWAQEQLSFTLSPMQREAIATSMQQKAHIITGGPGTGKSTITNAILMIANYLTKNILLAAPTGRAAKRMTEITGKESKTIHSLLEYNFANGGFKRKLDNPLPCDLIIVDEASMIDTSLMYSLLRAIPSHARIIFIGDIHQLPSVGAGNVLKDIIHSHRVPVTTLIDIFRQGEGSLITLNAQRINNGEFPILKSRKDADFFFFDVEDKEDVLDTIIHLVCSKIPKKFGFNPLNEIQVLAPMKRGVIGTENLNIVLQRTLNGKARGILKRGNKLCIGDKVMQIRNNYRKEVFNGDVGYITTIDEDMQKVNIDYDGRIIEYDFYDLNEIILAYACSIHKYQGSECPCVVMPVHTSHFKLLHRNLVYTGLTRGKKLVVIVGTKKAIAIALHHDEVQKRYTGLMQALFDMIGAGAPVTKK
jgi:exodeoxyribonuclease V alpha subunit